MKEYKTYKAAERNAEKMGLQLAEYGDLSNGKGYCLERKRKPQRPCNYLLRVQLDARRARNLGGQKNDISTRKRTGAGARYRVAT